MSSSKEDCLQKVIMEMSKVNLAGYATDILVFNDKDMIVDIIMVKLSFLRQCRF